MLPHAGIIAPAFRTRGSKSATVWKSFASQANDAKLFKFHGCGYFSTISWNEVFIRFQSVRFEVNMSFVFVDQ